MATLIPPTGKETEVHPANGESFTLEEMQGFVGGYVQVITLPDGRCLLMDEEGKMKGQSYNMSATLYGRKAGMMPSDEVVGTALLCTQQEMGD